MFNRCTSCCFLTSLIAFHSPPSCHRLFEIFSIMSARFLADKLPHCAIEWQDMVLQRRNMLIEQSSFPLKEKSYRTPVDSLRHRIWIYVVWILSVREASIQFHWYQRLVLVVVVRMRRQMFANMWVNIRSVFVGSFLMVNYEDLRRLLGPICDTIHFHAPRTVLTWKTYEKEQITYK